MGGRAHAQIQVDSGVEAAIGVKGEAGVRMGIRLCLGWGLNMRLELGSRKGCVSLSL